MSNIKRIFITGEEWLYYKIYCGARTSDTFLVETIQPLIHSLKQKEWIDQWFFIRYYDTDTHIRIRFHITDLQKIGLVISEIGNAVRPYVDNDIIHKIQTDTYIRELERYGAENIGFSETLFYYESDLLLTLIDQIEDEHLYFLMIIRLVDQMLDQFGYSLADKLKLSDANGDGYKREFEAGKYLSKQLDKKYRTLQEELVSFLSGVSTQEEHLILGKFLSEYSQRTNPMINKVEQYLAQPETSLHKDDLISSYIHMLVNRAFRSKQRFYELVCYDFLAKYYRGAINRKKAVPST